MLTITEDFLFFEPNFDDPFVQKNGILPYQLHVAMRDIFDVQIIKVDCWLVDFDIAG